MKLNFTAQQAREAMSKYPPRPQYERIKEAISERVKQQQGSYGFAGTLEPDSRKQLEAEGFRIQADQDRDLTWHTLIKW